MSTRRRQKKYKSRKGPQGKGVVRLFDDRYKIAFANKEVYEIPADDATGKYLDHIVEDEIAYIKMSPDEDQIWDMKPWNGSFFIRFVRFAAREDQPPTLKFREEKWIDTDDGGFPLHPADEFFPIFRIVGDTPWNGIEIMKSLEYVFVPQEGTNLTDLEGYKTPLQAVEEFMEVMAEWNWESDALEWTDERGGVLPQLESITQQRNGLGKATVKNGWMKEIEQPPTGVNYDQPEFE